MSFVLILSRAVFFVGPCNLVTSGNGRHYIIESVFLNVKKGNFPNYIINCRSLVTVEFKPEKRSEPNSRILSNFWGFSNSALRFFVLLDSLHYARTFHLLEFFSRSFSMSCVSFSMLDGPRGTSCDEVRQAFKIMHMTSKSFC